EARGFAVRTASATVVDFGTEFGVEAAADRSTRVEVFRGEVEAKAAYAAGDGAEAGRRLSHDQAVEVGADATAMKSVPPTPPEKGPHDFRAGAFTFRTHVDLAGFNLATADIAAHVLVDNFIKDVRVNGKRTGVSLPSDRNNTVAERTIRIPASSFKPGTNEIE